MASALWAYGAKILANCDNLGLIADQQLSAIDGFATRRRSPEGPALLLVVVEELKQDVYFEIDSAALQPRALSKLASSRLVALDLGQRYFAIILLFYKIPRSSGELNRTIMSEKNEGAWRY